MEDPTTLAVSVLDLHCLSMSNKIYTRHVLVNAYCWFTLTSFNWLSVMSADNLCKRSGPWSGPTECWV